MPQDISPKQLRAARALAGLTRDELAAKAEMTARTIARIEDADNTPRQTTVAAIQRALEKAGVVFIPENGGGAGVRLKKKQSTR